MPRHLLAVLLLFLSVTVARADDALLNYVKTPDDTYHYDLRRRINLGDVEAAELIVTSQTWRGITWKHQLFIIKPAQVTAPQQAVLVIDGGNWRDRLENPPAPDGSDIPREATLFAGLAQQFGSVVAIVRQVPFQPLFDEKLREDDAIAYTFDKFLATGEADWPLLLPMTKAAVRAMDTVQSFAHDEWDVDVERFTVTGASKRGWTTWLTAAVDDRAVAIAPMVIDMLNLQPQMQHQLEAWGSFSQMIQSYVELHIMDRMDTPQGQRLNAIVDPYAYRDRYTMPKLVVLGTNDPYWPVDALNLYWDGLPGEKRILYVPNAGHDLQTGLLSVVAGVIATHRASVGELTLPKLDWTFDEHDGNLTIRVTTDRTPLFVQAWSATTPTRDFRPSAWSARPLTPDADEAYAFTLKRPDAGHAAAYIDLTYSDGGMTYNLSTQIRVIPAAP